MSEAELNTHGHTVTDKVGKSVASCHIANVQFGTLAVWRQINKHFILH